MLCNRIGPVALIALLAACKGGGSAPETVEESLTRLGVDISETPRVNARGEALPDDYAPLGSSPRMNITHEWLVTGAALDAGGPTTTLLETEAGAEVTLTSGDGSTVPWADSGKVRDVVAGDIDGDGLEETIAVYRDANDITWVQSMDDEEGGFALSDRMELSRDDVTDVAAIAGDFDGDSFDEVAIALTTDAGTVLVRVEENQGGFRSVGGTVAEFPLRSDVYSQWVELAAASVDHDRGEEIVVVINESRPEPVPARLKVLDDAARGFAFLLEGTVAVSTELLTGSAPLAGVAVGDMDDDGVAEIVIGGLENPAYTSGCRSYDHLTYVLDDAGEGFELLAADRRSHFFDDCPAYAPWRLEGIHVNALEIDGDKGLEIAVNQFVYDDLLTHGALVSLVDVPDESFMFTQNRSGRFNRGTTDVAVGDVTGDGLDDLVMVSQSAADDIVVWGFHPIDGWSQQVTVPFQGSNATSPQWIDLTAVDVDPDGMALSYDDGAYKLVFTEPVIMAALAAAPCNDRIDQNLDACRTSWGQSESEQQGVDGSVSVHASVYSGFGASESFFGVEFGAEATSTVTASASFSAGIAYETTKTVSYTTGPLEDTVIFTSIPYDQWTYTVTSHPEPEMVGEQIVISMPRDPVTLMVERTFFNEHVVEGSTQVVEDVFTHVAGDPTSYRTPSQRDAILAANDGIASNPVTVGQGGGQTEVSIDFSQETSYRAGTEIDYTYDVKTTTAGFIFGYSVGGSVEAGLSWGTGSSTNYTGSVGQIASDDFADNFYTYGLFTYPVRANGQQFEVIDYWVE